MPETKAKSPDFGVRDPLVLSIKGARHGAEFGGCKVGFRRRFDAHQLCGEGHDILRRGRFVVGDIIDAAKLTLGQKPRCRADILDANAIEDLVRLDDALGGALFQIDEGVAPRPIDTREPEHGDGQT